MNQTAYGKIASVNFSKWETDVMDRVGRIRSLFDNRGLGLEIGPSHSPIMPKRDGFNVRILDYMDANGLRQKYSDAGVDVSLVEDVDYVGDGRSLVDIIGERHIFSWIVASHVVEHVPDLLKFLKDCSSLLKLSGQLVLAVPDKRCCFDILRPVSTVGQVLQAFIDRRSRPSPGVIFDDIAYARLRDGRSGWPLAQSAKLEAARPLEDTWAVFEKACRSDEYIDVHCWTFVPSSFRLIVSTLFMSGKCGLSVQQLESVDGEFYAVLSDVASPDLMDLGALAIAAQNEERQGVLIA